MVRSIDTIKTNFTGQNFTSQVYVVEKNVIRGQLRSSFSYCKCSLSGFVHDADLNHLWMESTDSTTNKVRWALQQCIGKM